jgi:photoactive yellow protein
LPSEKPVSFDAPDLSAQVETLSERELDRLPFGVIRLDREGKVEVYSETEARLSGYGKSPIGENFYAISPCAAKDSFRGRIVAAQEEGGPIDLEFAFPGDYGDPRRELRIRVQSSRRGGVWLFVERD